MIDYRFLSVAEEEMSEAAVFYEAASFGLGRDFLDDIQQAISTLRAHPQIGVHVSKGLRRMLLHRFPFSLIYSVEADAILMSRSHTIVSVLAIGNHALNAKLG